MKVRAGEVLAQALLEGIRRIVLEALPHATDGLLVGRGMGERLRPLLGVVAVVGLDLVLDASVGAVTLNPIPSSC